jgi:hypothetical protein
MKDLLIFTKIWVAVLSLTGASLSLAAGTNQPKASFRVQHCSTSAYSCGFYQCAEDVFRCGPAGYLLEVGAPLCNPEAYTNSESEQTAQFTQNVRKCLQEQVIQFAPTIRSCSELKDKALNSHIPCFVENGFCDLTMAQRKGIFKNGPKQFIKIAGTAKMLFMTHELVKACYHLKQGQSHD